MLQKHRIPILIPKVWMAQGADTVQKKKKKKKKLLLEAKEAVVW